MSRSSIRTHPSDPAYDPVVDGVGRGLADLFPPIHNPSHEENAAEDDAPPHDADGAYTDAQWTIRQP